ncbi:hypothetical protein OAG63_01620, partial [Methylacidiphilales bacterium]|nr:hypothetical protein [Candidatus Methylacidiphilales bacterium]
MHKEVCLPPADYPEIGLRLEASPQKAGESASPFASVPTSFGRALVVNHIPEADAQTWADGLNHAASDHRYYEVTRDSLGQQFEHYYLLLKDHSGSTRAIQPFLMVNQDLITGMPDAIRRTMTRIRSRFPSTLVMRMLMV